MKILVTGADGFIGKNLCARLKVIQEEKDRSHPNLFVDDLYEADRETPENLLVQYCAGADFIFHFAGVNRPKSPEQYIQGNYEFLSELVNILQVFLFDIFRQKCRFTLFYYTSLVVHFVQSQISVAISS